MSGLLFCSNRVSVKRPPVAGFLYPHRMQKAAGGRYDAEMES